MRTEVTTTYWHCPRARKKWKDTQYCYEILDGSCVSVDIALKLPRKAQASLQGCSPGSLNLATLSMESPQAESSAKRRRLTHRDMHVAAWTEGSSSGKKEGECEDVEDDSVKVKKEKVAQQIHSIDKDVQWLKVKKEIKEETEQDMKSSNFDDDIPLKEVEVKDEMENDEEDHDKWPQTSEVAVKQEVRRRLTRKVQVAPWTETSSSEKKESECEDVEDDSVKVKKEKVAQQIHSIDKDVQWLKVKKEITEDVEQDVKSSNFDDVDDVPLNEVEVKDEMESDEEDRDKSPQKSEVAVKQEVRRRLTRKVQVAPWTETSSSEKNGDGRAKIKMETVAEHEVSFASPLADADGHEDGRTHAGRTVACTCQVCVACTCRVSVACTFSVSIYAWDSQLLAGSSPRSHHPHSSMCASPRNVIIPPTPPTPPKRCVHVQVT